LTGAWIQAPNKRLVRRATIAAWAVVLVWAQLASSQDERQWEVKIDPADQACTADAECGHVTTRCDNCNDGAPVNKQHVMRYRDAYEALYRVYAGAHCARASPVFRFVCRDRRCAMEPFQ